MARSWSAWCSTSYGALLASPSSRPSARSISSASPVCTTACSNAIEDAVEELDDDAALDDERIRQAVRTARAPARFRLVRERRPIIEVQITRLGREALRGLLDEAGAGLMIGRLNHVAIAVPDLAAAAAQYRDLLGAQGVARRRRSRRMA